MTAWQNILPEATVKGVKKCFISNAMDGTDNSMLWSGGEEHGNVRRSVRKMKPLTVQMETVTLIGKGT